MILPELPLYTNNPVRDLELIKGFISDLHSALLNLDTDILDTVTQIGYATSGIVTDRGLTVGDTLANTQHVLGTLIEDLKVKGVISA